MSQLVQRTIYRNMYHLRNSEPSPKLGQTKSLVQSVGRDGMQLIEETMALRKMMIHQPIESIICSDIIHVLNRADRSAAFLAGYSSRFMDCPFYAEEYSTRCLMTPTCTQNDPNTNNTIRWDCLGFSFSRGIPCEQLWAVFILEKTQKGLSLFDLPK